MQYLYPLVAVHNTGYTELLYSNNDVTNFIKKYGRWHDQHAYWYTRFVNSQLVSTKETHPWIVRDDRGRTVKVDDFISSGTNWKYYNERQAKIRAIADKGLPIPYTGCRKAGLKMNHTAKKNSGSGHRNRNRALAIYEAKEYEVKNNIGGRVIPYENWL